MPLPTLPAFPTAWTDRGTFLQEKASTSTVTDVILDNRLDCSVSPDGTQCLQDEYLSQTVAIDLKELVDCVPKSDLAITLKVTYRNGAGITDQDVLDALNVYVLSQMSFV